MSPTILTILLAVASWAISGLITVTYMRASMKYMNDDIHALNEHLRSSDLRHEQLWKDFQDHRVDIAGKLRGW